MKSLCPKCKKPVLSTNVEEGGEANVVAKNGEIEKWHFDCYFEIENELHANSKRSKN